MDRPSCACCYLHDELTGVCLDSSPVSVDVGAVLVHELVHALAPRAHMQVYDPSSQTAIEITVFQTGIQVSQSERKKETRVDGCNIY